MSLLGIDIGTGGCKAGVFSADGECLASSYREYAARFPAEGHIELDSHDVWRKTREVIAEAAAGAGADPVTALCASSFGETMVPVSRDRRLLGPSIVCSDSRGAEYARRLVDDIGAEAFYRINPNIPGIAYSLPKLLWLRDHEPGLFRQADRFLLWADVVGFMLGCEPVTSNSHANRTLLFDLHANDWSDRLLEWSGLSRERLGRVLPGGAVAGTVADGAAEELGLPRGVRVVVGGHDQCTNALGSGVVSGGRAVCGIGSFECITPSFAHVPDLDRMREAGLNVEHHVLPGLYVSFLYNHAGTLVKWFRDTFAAAETRQSGGEAVYAQLAAELPAAPTRLLVLPYFEPTGSPHFVADAAGVILGLRSSTTRGDILKAIMESATLYFVEGMEVLRTLGVVPDAFVATGGGARSDAWLQIKADIFGVPFVRPRITEGSVLGAAMLAGLATGVFASADDAARRCVRTERVFEPDAARHAVYAEKAALYRDLFPATYPLLRRCREARN